MPETTPAPTALTVTDHSGVWLVDTETSRYRIDLDNLTATRLPGEGAGPVPGLPPVPTSQLRKDGDPLPILGIECRVGEPMVLLLSVVEGRLTRRATTIVRAITRA